MLGNTSQADHVADWLETLALSLKNTSIGVHFAKSIGEYSFDLSPELIGNAFLTAKSRSNHLEGNYPFVVGDGYLHAKENASSYAYSKCLGVSDSSALRSLSVWSTSASAKLFEEVVESCLVDFFGAQTKLINFGFPSTIGRPVSFPDAVEWLCKQTSMPVGSAYRSPRKKDGGVDVVVWKHLEDGWGSVPLLLVQVTIMQDFVNKISDIDLRLWSNWLSVDFNPLAALAVPHFVTDKNAWSEVSSRGLLFDRARLIRWHPGPSDIGNPVTSSYFDSLLVAFADSIS